MKRLRSLAMMAALLLFASSQVSAQKSDELAIKKVLQQETSSYFHKNYEGWADTWAHDSADYVLNAGPNGYNRLSGWTAIAAQYKDDIQNLQDRSEKEIEPFLNKHDYQIYVNENMATASFEEGNENPNVESRTLIKENGKWKILNFTLLNSKAYAMQQTINALKSFAGQWELDGKAIVEPNNEAYKLNSLKFDMKETPTGMEQRSQANFSFKNNTYAPPGDWEYFIPDYNTGTIFYLAVSKNSSGITSTQTGTVTSEKPGSFTVTVKYPDKPDVIQEVFTVTMKDGKWHQEGKQYDKDGKQIRFMSGDMRRVGS